MSRTWDYRKQHQLVVRRGPEPAITWSQGQRSTSPCCPFTRDHFQSNYDLRFHKYAINYKYISEDINKMVRHFSDCTENLHPYPQAQLVQFHFQGQTYKIKGQSRRPGLQNRRLEFSYLVQSLIKPFPQFQGPGNTHSENGKRRLPSTTSLTPLTNSKLLIERGNNKKSISNRQSYHQNSWACRGYRTIN